MAALSVSTVSAATVTDGTRQLPAVALLGADGSNFQPAMDAASRPGFVRLADGTNALALVDSANLPVAPRASATGGATPYSLIVVGTSQDTTTVKSSAGTVYAIQVQSVVAGVRYLKLYDKSTAPVFGDTPVMRIVIPGSTSGTVTNVVLPPCGVAFANGIGFRVTTGMANADTTGATANDNIIGIIYQ